MIAVVIDRRRARFFDVSNGAATELPDLRSPATAGGRFHSDRADAPGRGERRYHRHRLEEERRHYDRVVRRLKTLAVDRPDVRLFLAGPGLSAEAFRRHLPRELAAHLIGAARLNPARVTPATVAAAARAAAERLAADDQHALMAAMEEGLGTGRATNGARATLSALARREVRTLLLRDDVSGTGFRCAGSQRLVLSAVDCRGEGAPQPVADLIGAAIVEAIAQDAAVVVVRDRDLGRRIDGLAALLRFGP
jgi:peptide subunit release factor 1 (eRF1)